MALKISHSENLDPLNNGRPFPEIAERMELPKDRLIEVMDKHINRVYRDGEMILLNRFRNEWTERRDYCKSLLERSTLTDRIKQHLHECILYFDLFLHRSYHLEDSLVRSNVSKSDKTPEGQEIEYRDTTPKEEWDWIKNEYLNNRENFQTDDKWAEATAERFKEEFQTSEGSPSSMKRYGKYKGFY